LGGSSTRPLLGLRPWTQLGDFRPSGYLLLCVNPSPQRYRAVDATGCINNLFTYLLFLLLTYLHTIVTQQSCPVYASVFMWSQDNLKVAYSRCLQKNAARYLVDSCTPVSQVVSRRRLCQTAGLVIHPF